MVSRALGGLVVLVRVIDYTGILGNTINQWSPRRNVLDFFLVPWGWPRAWGLVGWPVVALLVLRLARFSVAPGLGFCLGLVFVFVCSAFGAPLVLQFGRIQSNWVFHHKTSKNR